MVLQKLENFRNKDIVKEEAEILTDLLDDITKNLVYSGSKDDVKMTVINGKILYENGEFVNIDKEEIYFSAQEVTNRLKK